MVDEGRYVILLQRIMFLETTKRLSFFRANPPKYVYVHSSRILIAKNGDFKKYQGGGRSMCFAWYIWQRGSKSEPILRWISGEPVNSNQLDLFKESKNENE